jgi:hypothetical protein
LIDFNEEIFTTSEALASAFSSDKPNTSELIRLAHSIEQRKVYLVGKVKQCIVKNPLVSKLQPNVQSSIAATIGGRSMAESALGAQTGVRQSLSPPQHEKNAVHFTQKPSINGSLLLPGNAEVISNHTNYNFSAKNSAATWAMRAAEKPLKQTVGERHLTANAFGYQHLKAATLGTHLRSE